MTPRRQTPAPSAGNRPAPEAVRDVRNQDTADDPAPIDGLHDIGRRIAAADPLHRVLARVVDFISSLVRCDSCFVYVLDDGALVLRASKNPHPDAVDRLTIRVGQGITGWVAQHREPVAVAERAYEDPRFQLFNELPEDRYQAFLSVPVLSRDKLVGVINVQHRQVHHHRQREIQLISTIGFLVGAEIEMARLEQENSQLSERLEERKAIDRAKGILQRDLGLSEEEAYVAIQRQSRQRRRSKKEIAEAIIISDEVRRSGPGAPQGFNGLSVLTLESRRSAEQATLIARFGGRPFIAPALREVPLETQAEAVAFVRDVVARQFDCVIFLTGVGARALLTVAATAGLTDGFVRALGTMRIVARGPKPLAVLREIGVPAWRVAPEPNTWRELLAVVDAGSQEFSLAGARVAVQEYGVSNPELLHELSARGAIVTAVPIYQWVLPDDVAPLREAVESLVSGSIDVVVLTSGIQLAHLYQVARDLERDQAMTRALERTVIASIGPTCSEEIRRRGLAPDIEASRPRMGMLVTETAAQAAALLARKRGR